MYLHKTIQWVSYLIRTQEFWEFFTSPYYGSGSPLSPCPEPLLLWQLFPSICSGQQLPEAWAQRELTASQTSAQQCKCSDNDSSVTDHLVPVCHGDKLCMHRKFSPSRTSLPCCTHFCHLCSVCRSPDTLIPESVLSTSDSQCMYTFCVHLFLPGKCMSWETLKEVQWKSNHNRFLPAEASAVCTQGGQLGHSGVLLQNTETPESLKKIFHYKEMGFFFLPCPEGKLSRAII